MRRLPARLSSTGISALALIGSLVVASPASAQYQGHNFKGDFGVNSGTQPLPGIYVLLPVRPVECRRNQGRGRQYGCQYRFGGFDLRAIPATVIGVTPRKVLGANYGFMVALPFSTITPERVDEDVDDPTDWGFTDMYVVPLYLGWRTPRADFVAGYGFYAPTGRYEPRATDNVGLGMWSHEIQGGVTAYADAAKKVSLATTAFFEMHSKKKDLDLKVGNMLTLEGGVAYNLPTIGGAFGLAYFAQMKVSDDSGSDFPELLLGALNLRERNRLFGFGPDVTVGLFQRGTTAGLLNVRYLWQSGGKTTFEGSTVWIAFTIAKIGM